jgi:2-polyprenyl-3-methyl-5-hydroxy-6-metoxy-1,4-benzoquinol methylase
MNKPQNETLIESLDGCPCCDSEELQMIDAPGEWIDKEHFASVRDYLRLSRCRRCGLVFINPRPSGQLLASFYNKPGYDCHDYDFEAAQSESDAEARFRIFERFKSGGSLLDFGPGAGHLLRFAKRKGWSVAGIELGQHARESLQREGFDVYASLGDAGELRGSIDVVTMVHVLEHLVDFAAILAGVRELLQPRGIFYVEVPNAASLRARLSESFLKPWFNANTQKYLAFPIHLYYFSPRSLVRFLKRHGFEVLELRTLGLGVDELWAGRSQTADEGEATGPVAASTASDSTARPARSSSPYAGLKNSVKAGMSYLKLGENLVAVCRRAGQGQPS